MYSFEEFNGLISLLGLISCFAILLRIFKGKFYNLFDPLVFFFFYLSSGIGLSISLVLEENISSNYLLLVFFNTTLLIFILRYFLPNVKTNSFENNLFPNSIFASRYVFIYISICILIYFTLIFYKIFALFSNSGFVDLKMLILQEGRTPLETILDVAVRPPIFFLGNIFLILKISFPKKVKLSFFSKILIACVLITPIINTLELSRSAAISTIFSICIASSFLSATFISYNYARLKNILIILIAFSILWAILTYAFVLQNSSLFVDITYFQFLKESSLRIIERLLASADSIFYMAKYGSSDLFLEKNPIDYISGPYGKFLSLNGVSAGNILFNKFSNDFEINAGSNFNFFISIFTSGYFWSPLATITLGFTTIFLRRIIFQKLIFSNLFKASNIVYFNLPIIISFYFFNSFVFLTDAELAFFNYINILIGVTFVLLITIILIFFFSKFIPKSIGLIYSKYEKS